MFCPSERIRKERLGNSGCSGGQFPDVFNIKGHSKNIKT